MGRCGGVVAYAQNGGLITSPPENCGSLGLTYVSLHFSNVLFRPQNIMGNENKTVGEAARLEMLKIDA